MASLGCVVARPSLQGDEKMSAQKVTIAKLTAEQLDDAVEVERLCFITPWGRDALAQDLARAPVSCYVGASLADGRLVGFAGMWVVEDEAHIGTIGVHPSFRRLGIGEMLLYWLLCESVERGVNRVTLEVRTSNYAAQALYGKYGFEKAGIRRRYYQDTDEDGLIMILTDLSSRQVAEMLEARKMELDARLCGGSLA